MIETVISKEIQLSQKIFVTPTYTSTHMEDKQREVPTQKTDIIADHVDTNRSNSQ